MKHGFLAAKAIRIFSVLLCLLMLGSMFPLGAYAEGTETAPAVRFLCDETAAQVTVYDSNGAALPTGADGLHHLTPGTYYYSAEAEGYESTGRQAFTVPYDAAGDQELRITMTPVAGSTAPAGPTGNPESGANDEK